MAQETAAAEEAKETPEEKAPEGAETDAPETDAGEDIEAKKKKKSEEALEEEKRRAIYQRTIEAINLKHKEVCENPNAPSESEAAVEARRKRATHYLAGMDGYETREKYDRVEFFFDGQDKQVHTVFQTTVQQDGEDRMFFGYYGRAVDEEASLASVLKAVEAGLESVEVQGTKKQKELLARLAVEHGLEVSNYDTSAFEGPKDTIDEAPPEAGVTESEADADADAPVAETETPEPAELALATVDNQPDAEPEVTETALSTDVLPEAEPDVDDLRSRFYEDAKNGEWIFVQDKDGNTVMYSAKHQPDNNSTQFADEDIVDAEFEDITEPKSSFGSTDAPKQIGAGEGQVVSGYLEAKQDDKPAASSNFLPAPKDDDDKPKSDDTSPKQITDGGRSGQKRLPGPSGNKP